MKLPNSVQEIAEVIGRERALFLVGQLPRCYARDPRWPGAKSEHVILYVPTVARLKPDHELVRILGWNDAVKLAQAFGGEILKPGNCSGIYRDFRDQNIIRIVREGTPVVMVASWFGVTDRHVRKLMQENPQEERRAANDNNTGVQIHQRRSDDKPRRQQRA
jgi:hypothetical protein